MGNEILSFIDVWPYPRCCTQEREGAGVPPPPHFHTKLMVQPSHFEFTSFAYGTCTKRVHFALNEVAFIEGCPHVRGGL